MIHLKFSEGPATIILLSARFSSSLNCKLAHPARFSIFFPRWRVEHQGGKRLALDFHGVLCSVKRAIFQFRGVRLFCVSARRKGGLQAMRVHGPFCTHGQFYGQWTQNDARAFLVSFHSKCSGDSPSGECSIFSAHIMMCPSPLGQRFLCVIDLFCVRRKGMSIYIFRHERIWNIIQKEACTRV